jgi:hypothetical protein
VKFQRTNYDPISKPKHRRADKHRTDDLPIPKVGVRIEDEAAKERARRRGFCEVCLRRGVKLDPHHIKSQGSGGHDADGNLISSVSHLP